MSPIPVTLIDQWIDLAENRLTLNRIYRIERRQHGRGDKIRVVVQHDQQEHQSHARVFVLSEGRTWTELVSAPPATWWKPSMHPSDLEPVAIELVKRACKVLR